MPAFVSTPISLVDAHVHLWNLSSHSWYPAMQDPDIARSWSTLGDVRRMARDFLWSDYRQETADQDVTGIVHVSATTSERAYLQEARWVDEVLDAAGVPAVTIGTVEPSLDHAQLEADLEAQTSSSRFRGIRVLSGLNADGATADRLCAWLAERGYVFDLVTHGGDAEAWSRLLERHAELDVVIEHCGWPSDMSSRGRVAWRAGLATLAENPRIRCKVSGLGMVTHTLTAEALVPWVEGCLDIFGADRCLFGGNFPVDAMYGTYGELIEAVSVAADGLGPAGTEALFSDNARRVYGI